MRNNKTDIRGYITSSPVPGNWYVDKEGALFKCRAIVVVNGKPDHVIVDYPQGCRRKVSLCQWRRFVYQVSMPVSGQQEQA